MKTITVYNDLGSKLFNVNPERIDITERHTTIYLKIPEESKAYKNAEAWTIRLPWTIKSIVILHSETFVYFINDCYLSITDAKHTS